MPFPVVYGKTKLASATSGGAILDSGDLNYSVEHIEFTLSAFDATLSGPRSSLYIVSGTAGNLRFPREWEENIDAQRDGRGTGWRISVLSLGARIEIFSNHQNLQLDFVPSNEIRDFIFSPNIGMSHLFRPSGLALASSTNYLIFNPVRMPL